MFEVCEGGGVMKLGTLKNVVGGLLVGQYIIALVLCFVWLDSRLEPQDFRLTILILTPVTAVYALAYVKDVAKTMFQEGTSK
ncbi:MAG: hypothetical protein DLM68_03960, partial [Hyphomicrobiales bacterium]